MVIVQHPDPVLRKISEPLKGKPDKDLVKAMSDYKGRVAGLAAVQLGVPVRFIMVRGGTFYYFLINPEIVEVGMKTSVSGEGCMSIENGKKFIEVPRPTMVRVKYTDLALMPRKLYGTGLLARALQHEIDHLNGKLIID